jgi:addiction module HigA family antidote
MTTNKMRPIHPGEILREELDEIRLSARALAAALKVPANRISAILNEGRGITADTALRLARFFGTSPEFWLNLQSAYDLRLAQRTAGVRIVREVQLREEIEERADLTALRRARVESRQKGALPWDKVKKQLDLG